MKSTQALQAEVDNFCLSSEGTADGDTNDFNVLDRLLELQGKIKQGDVSSIEQAQSLIKAFQDAPNEGRIREMG